MCLCISSVPAILDSTQRFLHIQVSLVWEHLTGRAVSHAHALAAREFGKTSFWLFPWVTSDSRWAILQVEVEKRYKVVGEKDN